MTPEHVREWGRFATTSPIYSRLIEAIANDDDLLRILNRIEHLPRPNVLFAGVQYLMMEEGGGHLAAHYPNFPQFDPEADGVEGPFRDFVLAHEEELVEIGRTRYTQTNECRRCVALLPGIWKLGYESFHLVDIGASAGLNLLLDRYRYRWGDVEWGPSSPVALETENRGVTIVPRPVDVLSRTGLDLNPIDRADPHDRKWLEALVWPEHDDRRRRLRAALSLADSVDLDLVGGDALETLGPTLAALPADEPAVVMHSFALNQFTGSQRARVTQIIGDARAQRPVGRVSFEWNEARSCVVTVDGGSEPAKVGRAQHHGEWVEFYALP